MPAYQHNISTSNWRYRSCCRRLRKTLSFPRSQNGALGTNRFRAILGVPGIRDKGLAQYLVGKACLCSEQRWRLWLPARAPRRTSAAPPRPPAYRDVSADNDDVKAVYTADSCWRFYKDKAVVLPSQLNLLGVHDFRSSTALSHRVKKTLCDMKTHTIFFILRLSWITLLT